MLFENEESEECCPVFPKPKKVHPNAEDDMVRRIKNTLGDYENVCNAVSSEGQFTNDILDAIVASSNIAQDTEKIPTSIDDCTNISSETSTLSSRRSSLKRQCKERISLLDYNPMLTIRTKRTKGCISNRSKSLDSLEDSKKDIRSKKKNELYSQAKKKSKQQCKKRKR